jgi:hypothetical protein
MKIFTDPGGSFVIKIPIEWQYRNEIFKSNDKTPHSFELYDNAIGCFCISCRSKYLGSFPLLIKNYNLITQKKGKTKLNFVEKVTISNSTCLHVWMAVVDEKFILASYNYDINKSCKKQVFKEIQKVKRSLSTVICIKPEDKDRYLSIDRYDKFMYSLVAAIDLTNRAYENGSTIELTILLANHIDALLRLSIMLNRQINNKNDKIDKMLIFQNISDKPILEREIYRIAFVEKVINENIYNKLNELYEERNKIVHRYIISDIKTMDMIRIVNEYGTLSDQIGKITNDLEEKQFKLKIGIHSGNTSPNRPLNRKNTKKLIYFIKDKHANSEVNKHITIK